MKYEDLVSGSIKDLKLVGEGKRVLNLYFSSRIISQRRESTMLPARVIVWYVNDGWSGGGWNDRRGSAFMDGHCEGPNLVADLEGALVAT